MPSNGHLCEMRWEMPRGIIRGLDRLAVLNGISRRDVVEILLEQGLRQHGMPARLPDPAVADEQWRLREREPGEGRE